MDHLDSSTLLDQYLTFMKSTFEESKNHMELSLLRSDYISTISNTSDGKLLSASSLSSSSSSSTKSVNNNNTTVSLPPRALDTNDASSKKDIICQGNIAKTVIRKAVLGSFGESVHLIYCNRSLDAKTNKSLLKNRFDGDGKKKSSMSHRDERIYNSAVSQMGPIALVKDSLSAIAQNDTLTTEFVTRYHISLRKLIECGVSIGDIKGSLLGGSYYSLIKNLSFGPRDLIVNKNLFSILQLQSLYGATFEDLKRDFGVSLVEILLDLWFNVRELNSIGMDLNMMIKEAPSNGQNGYNSLVRLLVYRWYITNNPMHLISGDKSRKNYVDMKLGHGDDWKEWENFLNISHSDLEKLTEETANGSLQYIATVLAYQLDKKKFLEFSRTKRTNNNDDDNNNNNHSQHRLLPTKKHIGEHLFIVVLVNLNKTLLIRNMRKRKLSEVSQIQDEELLKELDSLCENTDGKQHQEDASDSSSGEEEEEEGVGEDVNDIDDDNNGDNDGDGSRRSFLKTKKSSSFNKQDSTNTESNSFNFLLNTVSETRSRHIHQLERLEEMGASKYYAYLIEKLSCCSESMRKEMKTLELKRQVRTISGINKQRQDEIARIEKPVYTNSSLTSTSYNPVVYQKHVDRYASFQQKGLSFHGTQIFKLMARTDKIPMYEEFYDENSGMFENNILLDTHDDTNSTMREFKSHVSNFRKAKRNVIRQLITQKVLVNSNFTHLPSKHSMHIKDHNVFYMRINECVDAIKYLDENELPYAISGVVQCRVLVTNVYNNPSSMKTSSSKSHGKTNSENSSNNKNKSKRH